MGNSQSRREQPQESSSSEGGLFFWPLSAATNTHAPQVVSPGDTTTSNPAAHAFRRHYGGLMRTIVEPLPLAVDLYSRKIIPAATKEKVQTVGLTLMEKRAALLDAVEARIQSYPSDFWGFIAALEGDPLLQISATRLRHSYRELTETTDTSSGSPSSAVIARYADYLTAYYSTAVVAPEALEYPKWPPTPSKKYINLALVKRDKVSRAEADSFTKATLHNNVDEILKKKERIHLKDIFKPEQGQASLKWILVEGAPGVGKSTFAWELCRRWDDIEAMRQFSLVVLLRLREKRVQEARTVADLFYHDDSSLQEAVAQEVVAKEGLSTLLILDGFDEYPVHLRKNSLIARIIRGTVLPKCTVLVTSRPSARADLLSVVSTQVHKHIEVLGFTPEGIKQYAKSVFASNKPLLSDFLTYISASPAIRGAMYIPLNSAIVVQLYRENKVAGRPIPQTMTQLYTDLSFTLLRRYLSAKGDQRANSLPEKLEELPQDLYDQLLTLARLAFEGIVKQEVIFASLPEGYTHFGFMNAEGEVYLGSRGTMSYNFLHLTLQEYLGAFYFSTLPVDEQVRVFEHYSDKEQYSHMDVVWRFVAGLTGFRGIGWEVVQARRGRDEYKNIVPFLVQCLYEAQDEAACESVLGRGEVVFWGYERMTTLDCFSVGYCIAASKCVWKLFLDRNHLGAEMVEMLVCGLKRRAEVSGCIWWLSLSGNPIKQEGVTHLQKLFQQVRLLEFDVSYCALDGTALDLLSEIIPTMTSLQDLDVSGNPAGAGGMVRLFQALSNLSSLRTLTMSAIPIGIDDVTALSQLIRRLRKLDIGYKEMPIQCAELMTRTVFAPSSLEELWIWNVDLTSCSTSFQLLQVNHKLTRLILRYCNIGSHGTCCLAKALHKNTALKVLWFDMRSVPTSDQIGMEGAVALTEMLTVNHSLEELTIVNDNSLGQDGVCALISSLQDNHTLRSLTLPKLYHNHFTSDELDSRVEFQNT